MNSKMTEQEKEIPKKAIPRTDGEECIFERQKFVEDMGPDIEWLKNHCFYFSPRNYRIISSSETIP